VGSEQTALDNNVQQLCTPAKAGDPPSADCKRLLALANIAKAVVGTGVGVTDFVP
jgi:hypothetical protein